jgi:hypothetical protein
MSSRDNEGAAEKGGRGRRRPPTIEATAERLADHPADHPADTAVTPENPAPAVPVQEEAATGDTPPSSVEPAPEATATEAPEPAAAPPAEPVAPSAVPSPAQRPSLALPVSVAAVIGALVAFGGTMLLQPKPVTEQALAPLAERLGALEAEVASLDPALKTLAQRIAASETAAKSSTTASAAPDLGPLEQRLGALEASVKQLPTASSDNGAAERLASLASAQQQQDARLAALQEKLGAAAASEAQAQAQAAAPATLALAQALGQALNSGRPYATELAALARLGQPNEALAPLQAFAAAGAPTNAALATDFAQLAKDFAAQQQPAADQSLTARLLASAARLVRIRPVGAPAGDDLAAVSARIEAALRSGDIAAVEADAAKLPAAARQQAKPVLDKARTRSGAAAALARIEQGVFAAIAGQ